MARLELIQWRKPFDDEDELSILINDTGADDALAVIREEYDIPEPASGSIDEDGCIIVTNFCVFDDGTVLHRNGKDYRIRIEEVRS